MSRAQKADGLATVFNLPHPRVDKTKEHTLWRTNDGSDPGPDGHSECLCSSVPRLFSHDFGSGLDQESLFKRWSQFAVFPQFIFFLL